MQDNPRSIDLEFTGSGGRHSLSLNRPTLAISYAARGYMIVPDGEIADEMNQGTFEQNIMFIQLPFGQRIIWIKFDPTTNALPQVSTLRPTQDRDNYDSYEHVYVQNNGKYTSVWRPRQS